MRRRRRDAALPIKIAAPLWKTGFIRGASLCHSLALFACQIASHTIKFLGLKRFDKINIFSRQRSLTSWKYVLLQKYRILERSHMAVDQLTELKPESGASQMALLNMQFLHHIPPIILLISEYQYQKQQ